jgi:adenosylhomocysteine nucleosidase
VNSARASASPRPAGRRPPRAWSRLRACLAAILVALVLGGASCTPAPDRSPAAAANPGLVAVLVSADAEWRVVKAVYPSARFERAPFGEYFETPIAGRPVVFVHGGWGKVAAAGSTQYVIDRWKPALLVNLGTCGGFAGDVERFEVVLVDRTIIYDIKEAMGDSASAIADYSTTIDLGWLKQPYPATVRRTLLVSGDRDLVPSELAELQRKYHAVAGDWESGAIAYVCARNRQRVLILRGVSDLVSATAGGEAYGNLGVFEDGTRKVMTSLLSQLPSWIR